MRTRFPLTLAALPAAVLRHEVADRLAVRHDRLEDVRGLLELVDGEANSCAEVKARTLGHAEDIHQKIVDLKKIERVLQSMAARCDDGQVPECPVIEALFKGPQTPGPRQ